MAMLPAGTVTFLFSDIEGSTRLLQQLGDRYGDVVGRHRRLIREAAREADGNEVDTQGDAFFFSFSRARDAVGAAITAQRRLAAEEWPDGLEMKVRMGLHTGEPTLGDEGYVGLDVVRGARISQAAHGGQILLSESTRALLPAELPDGARIVDVGEHALKGLERPERLFQVEAPGLAAAFPALRAEQPEAPHDALARRIDAFVEKQLASAFDESDREDPDRSRGWFRRRRKRT